MTRLLRIVATVTLLIGPAACGPGGGEPGGRTSDTDLQALGRELSKCVRDNGVPEFPDPAVRDGDLVMPQDQPADAVDDAMAACRSIVDRIPRRPGGEGSGARDVPRLRTFARCLRENGVPDWPDPRPDGSFPVLGTPLDGKTPELQRALAACRKHWERSWSVS
ncbi:hypothetical protein ACIBCT_23040 [Streptosporangium sp. NPDC050855]|uniref:hypothetical protein n=1 Tax=Streptosporangium sp. NPDC050855 TaxID=3366194 RepID=UPI00378CA7DB